MKSILSILAGILAASSAVTAASTERSLCTDGTYECGAGNVQIWVCIQGGWTIAASCGPDQHCEEVSGIPSCLPGRPVY